MSARLTYYPVEKRKKEPSSVEVTQSRRNIKTLGSAHKAKSKEINRPESIASTPAAAAPPAAAPAPGAQRKSVHKCRLNNAAIQRELDAVATAAAAAVSRWKKSPGQPQGQSQGKFHTKAKSPAQTAIQTQKDNIKDSPPRMRQKSRSQMDAKAPIPQNRYSNKMCQEKKSKEKHHSMLCITRDTFPSDAKHRQQMEILQREESRQMKQELELQDNQRPRIEAESDPKKLIGSAHSAIQTQKDNIKDSPPRMRQKSRSQMDAKAPIPQNRYSNKMCQEKKSKEKHHSMLCITRDTFPSDAKHRQQMEILQREESRQMKQELELQDNQRPRIEAESDPKKLIGSAHSAIQTQKDNIKDSPPRMRQKSRSQMDAKAPIPQNRYSNKMCQEKKSKEKHHSMLCITRDTFPSDAKHRQQMEILQREEGRQMKQELDLKDNQRRRIEAESDPKKLIGSAHSAIQTQKDNIKDSPPRMRQKSRSQMDAKAPIPQNRFSNKMWQEKKSKEKHHSMICITRNTFPSDAKHRQQMEILQREESRQMKQELELQDNQRPRIEAENDPLKETTEQESKTIKEIERKVCEHTEKKADESLSKGEHNDSTTYANVSFHSKKLIGSAHSAIQTQKDNIKDSPPRMRQKSRSQMDAKAPIPQNRYSNKMWQEKKSKEKHHSMICITRNTFPSDAKHRQQMEILQREESRQMKQELELQDNQRPRIEAENDPLKETTEQESKTIKEIERKVCEHTEKKADESLSKGEHNDSTTYANVSFHSKKLIGSAHSAIQTQKDNIKDSPRMRQKSRSQMDAKAPIPQNRYSNKMCQEKKSKEKHHSMICITRNTFPSDAKHRQQMEILQREESRQMKQELELQDNQRPRIEAESDPKKLIGSAHSAIQTQKDNIKDSPPRMRQKSRSQMDAKAPIPQNRYSNKMCQEKKSKEKHHSMLCITRDTFPSDAKHRQQMEILQREESRQMKQELELKDTQRRRIEAESDPKKLIGSAHSDIQTQKDNIKDSPPKMRQKSQSQMDAKGPIPQNRYSNKMCQEKESKEKHHSMICITRDTFPLDAMHRLRMVILQREEERQMKQELELKDNQRRRIEAESDPKKLIGSAHSDIQTQKDNIKDSPPKMRQKSQSQMDAKGPIPQNRYSNKMCQEKESKEKHHSMICITRDTFPLDAMHRLRMVILQREEERQMKQELELKDTQRRRIEAENDPLKEATEQESMTIKEIERKVCEHTEKKADESLSKGQHNDSTTYANVSFHSKKLIGLEHSPGQDNDSKIADYFLKSTPPKQICEDLERANELNRGHDRIYELFWLEERREEEKYRRMLAQNDQEELPVHSCGSCRHRHHKHNHNARFDNLRPTEDDIQEADSSPESN
ncbi:LOW QUALITY PROTEIN: thyroid receptor-interacting protein 11 [Drosophila sechellia]|uniref:LOW QUALITY PROTEIN: thyroid receptor-interacting protein 11 n=1 Tax=Drosophila sechellia TaxID=7238 RepID=UPI0013DE5A47|nr:LOW QUALITY PROTEIN: thyroid receptor-interacting protein 11 [Drosophila sechellia]